MSVGLGAKTTGGRARVVEIASKGGHEERAEDEFGAPVEAVSQYHPRLSGGNTYLNVGRESQSRNTNLKV